MKLSKIYSNKESLFKSIRFNDGFNVIVGEIRREKNKNEDTHNLGKSTLAELIDFCLLKTINKKKSFLLKHEDKFKEFIFFLEIKLNDGKYITIRRSVSANTKISIKKHSKKDCNFNSLHNEDQDWDYFNLSIDRAKKLLDAILDLDVVTPWTFRHALKYALRGQEDFVDIFKLKSFQGKHVEWKPYIAKLLGFDPNLLIENYKLKDKVDDLDKRIEEVKNKIGVSIGNELEVLTDLLTIKEKNISLYSSALDEFNFEFTDKENTQDLVSQLDEEIKELNKVRYYLKSSLQKLYHTLSVKDASFNINDTEMLFKEAGVSFGDSIKKTYSELLEFRKKITIERSFFAKKQILELEESIHELELKSETLNQERAKKIQLISNKNTIEKYKDLTKNLVAMSGEINEIKKKISLATDLRTYQSDKEALKKEKESLIDDIKENRNDVVKNGDKYREIKVVFRDFIYSVLAKHGLITTEVNKEGNLDFYAGIINGMGEYTGESDGHTYKKILCIGYDISVMIAYSNAKFIKFLYHDGGLETLDDRKKISFLNYVKSTPIHFNTQYILTLIDSDLPSGFTFDEGDIIRVLHDDGQDGLLFNMPPW